MIEWTKLPIPDCLTQDPTLAYVVPHDDGSEIWLNGEKCLIENAAVRDVVDKFNAIGCTSFQFSKEEMEAAIEQFKNGEQQ